MDYFRRYPDIEQNKKHKSKKVFCAIDFFGTGLKVSTDIHKHIV